MRMPKDPATRKLVKQFYRSQHKARPRRRRRRPFKTYAEYLATPEWARLRAKALRRAKGRCQHCHDKAASQVHHTRYPPDLRDDRLNNLVPVCGGCHMKAHGIPESVPSTQVDDPETTQPLCAAEQPAGSTPPSTYGHEEKALDRSPESQ